MDELTNFGEYLTLFAGLFAMLNIAKNIPLFLNFTAEFSRSNASKTAISASVTTLISLTAFTVFGDSILLYFNITISHVQISGGIILLINALTMVGAIRFQEARNSEVTGNPIAIGVSPLGIPLIAGPGAITTVMVYAQIHPSYLHIIVVCITILITSILLFITLQIAVFLGNFIGPTAAILINRIMGLIVAAIAVNFLVSGIKTAFQL